jgi:hypothetical protein
MDATSTNWITWNCRVVPCYMIVLTQNRRSASHAECFSPFDSPTGRNDCLCLRNLVRLSSRAAPYHSMKEAARGVVLVVSPVVSARVCDQKMFYSSDSKQMFYSSDSKDARQN